MPRKRTRITTTPELRKQKRGGYSVRFRIPAHDGEPERKSPWKRFPDAKTKGLALQEAETYRKELEDEINDYSLKKDITFGQYARSWHEDRQDSGELNGLSYDREELLIKKIERTKLAAIPIEDLTEEDIDEFKSENARNGESKNEQSRLLKKVKQILRHAESRRSIKHDPSRVVKDVKAESKKRRSLTLEQQHDLMKALFEEEKDGRHAAILIAMATGLRRGEILGLMWKDFDFKKQQLTVERQLNKEGKIVPPKYDSVGVLPLDEDTCDWLRVWKSSVAKQSGRTGEKLANTPICCNGKYEYYLPSNFDRWRRRYFVDHKLGTFGSVYTTKDEKGNVRKHYKGFKGYDLHELRHTVASELIGSGADIHTVQTIMRHKRLSTTEQYLHDIPENLTEAVEKVAEKRRRYNPMKSGKKRFTYPDGYVRKDGTIVYTRWELEQESSEKPGGRQRKKN